MVCLLVENVENFFIKIPPSESPFKIEREEKAIQSKSTLKSKKRTLVSLRKIPENLYEMKGQY